MEEQIYYILNYVIIIVIRVQNQAYQKQNKNALITLKIIYMIIFIIYRKIIFYVYLKDIYIIIIKKYESTQYKFFYLSNGKRICFK